MTVGSSSSSRRRRSILPRRGWPTVGEPGPSGRKFQPVPTLLPQRRQPRRFSSSTPSRRKAEPRSYGVQADASSWQPRRAAARFASARKTTWRTCSRRRTSGWLVCLAASAASGKLRGNTLVSMPLPPSRMRRLSCEGFRFVACSGVLRRPAASTRVPNPRIVHTAFAPSFPFQHG